MCLAAGALYQGESPILFSGSIDPHSNTGRKRKRGARSRRCDLRSTSAVTFQSCNQRRKIVRLDNKWKFFDRFDAPPIIANCFRRSDFTDVEQELLALKLGTQFIH